MMTIEKTMTRRSRMPRHKGASKVKSSETDEEVFKRYVKAGLPLNVKLEECLPREVAELNELLAGRTTVEGPADDPLSHYITVKEEPIDMGYTALDTVACLSDPLSSLQPEAETEEVVIKMECEVEETQVGTAMWQGEDKVLEALQAHSRKRQKCSQSAADNIAICKQSKRNGDSQKCTNKPKTPAKLRQRRAMMWRLRRSTESTEERELRRLRQRITTIKLRLRTQLNSTEDELAARRVRLSDERRREREKQLQLETEEEKAARKQQQKVRGASRRIRIESIEAPEETLRRKQLYYAQNKARYMKRLSQETAEQQAARKKRVREYYQRYRRLKTAKVEQSLNLDAIVEASNVAKKSLNDVGLNKIDVSHNM